METIKFSHKEYMKFEGVAIDEPMILIETFKKHKSQMSEKFLVYDATYINEDGKKEMYPLSDEEMLILLFMDVDGKLLTTCRRWMPSKEDYYNKKRGEQFEFVITEGEIR